MQRNAQYPLSVTIERIKQWKSSGQKFQVEYECARFEVRTGPEYRCQYILPDTGETFTLVNPDGENREDHARLLRDRLGVIRHHRQYGDGRDLLFDQDLEVYLV